MYFLREDRKLAVVTPMTIVKIVSAIDRQVPPIQLNNNNFIGVKIEPITIVKLVRAVTNITW